MTLEIQVKLELLESKRHIARQRLNGRRFNIKELFDYDDTHHGRAESEVEDRLCDFLIAQSASWLSANMQIGGYEAVLVATNVAAQYAAEKSAAEKSWITRTNLITRTDKTPTGKIPTNKISLEKISTADPFSKTKIDFKQDLTQVQTDLLGAYFNTAREKERSLTELTDSFFSWCLNITYEEWLKNEEDVMGICITIANQKYGIVGKQVEGSEEANQQHVQHDIPRHLSVQHNALKHLSSSLNSSQYIYGHEEIKGEFRRLSQMIEHKEFLSRRFDPNKLFKNYLLVGPPGTGKTTLLQSLAARTNMAYLEIACVELGSEFFSKTSRNLHEVYLNAEKKLSTYPGVIICFDEFDHIAKTRGYGNSSENDACITTLNDHLDGTLKVPGIITVGATNCEKMIDPAVRRRMQRYYIGYPENDADIVGVHQAIIKRMEDYAGTKIFADPDFSKILPFAQSDQRYRSGSNINQILHNAAISQALSALPSREVSLVTTEGLLQAYQLFQVGEITGAEKESPELKVR